jgi:hypothetical protein
MEPLSRTDVTALRQADSVSFHFSSAEGVTGTYGDYGASIVCKKRHTQAQMDRDPYGDTERRYDLETTCRFTDYARHSTNDPPPIRHCFEMIHSPGISETWQTVIALLRAGDHLMIHWIRDNNTTALEEAQIHVDEMRLVIMRQAKGGGFQRKYTFRMATSVCKDNYARMIRSF